MSSRSCHFEARGAEEFAAPSRLPRIAAPVSSLGGAKRFPGENLPEGIPGESRAGLAELSRCPVDRFDQVFRERNPDGFQHSHAIWITITPETLSGPGS